MLAVLYLECYTREKRVPVLCKLFFGRGVMKQLSPHLSPFRSPQSSGQGNVLSSSREVHTHLPSHLLQGKAQVCTSGSLSSNVVMGPLAAHSQQKLQNQELNTLATPTLFLAQP